MVATARTSVPSALRNALPSTFGNVRQKPYGGPGGRAIPMENVGWATAALPAVGGVFLVLTYVLDQIPGLSAKAEKAITALRRLRAAWRGAEKPAEGEQATERRDEQEGDGGMPDGGRRR